MICVLFKDDQEKQFILTCCASLEGKPCKHHGKIKDPKVVEQYLQIPAGIDIHNHVRTGSSGLEDVWSTKYDIHWQFAGILGFSFISTSCAATYFTLNSQNKSVAEACHVNFKIKLANQLFSFKLANEKPGPIFFCQKNRYALRTQAHFTGIKKARLVL